MRQFLFGAALLICGVPPLLAQTFTSATEVRPILEATRNAWVAVREYDGKDLLYFTQVLSWRCGLTEIRYGLNGADADTVFAMEPCYEGEASPNALKTEIASQIYLTLPLKSVDSIRVVLVLDDGSEMSADFDRAATLMP